ncbi:MAG: hypothetical protein DRQ78_04790 [Epsilonproteobacteria bacterium]|nr:MAG: hypothetical protein DRQ78_04790 [Campylobacterota bacterium]
MLRFYFILFLFFLETAVAKNLIDCRALTSGATECNPYGNKFIWAKGASKEEIAKARRFRSKTNIISSKQSLRIISVEDMIKKYKQSKVTFEEIPTNKKSIIFEKILIEPALTSIEEKDIKTASKVNEIIEKQIKVDINYGYYKVVSGDSLHKIAKKFSFKTKVLLELNAIKNKSMLSINQKIKLPLSQEIIDAWVLATYTVKQGDTLIGIASKFNIEPKHLVRFNHITSAIQIHAGKVLKLPLPYVLAERKAKQKAAKRKKQRLAEIKNNKFSMIGNFGTRKLRVTATAYSSHVGQTDSTPFLAAWNNRLYPGIKSIAVSRDMLSKYGMRNGSKVRIGGLKGYYRVLDKMNKRYKKRIDIYMGLDRNRALRWGKRSVIIYW